MSPEPVPPVEQTTPDDTMPEPMPPPVDDTMTPPPTGDTLPPDTTIPPPVDTPTDPETPDASTDPTVPPAGCPTSLSDRTHVAQGHSVSGRLDLGCPRNLKKQK